MELKNYQIDVMNDLRSFLNALVEKQSIKAAYNHVWETKGVPVGMTGMPPYNDELPGVPQVCFKVPTGGGKTFLAANSIKPIFDSMPNVHPRAVVWLVPSDAILTQTYATLTNKAHDYRRKIDVDFGNKVEVYSKSQLLVGQNFNPTSVSENLSIFVLSYDSFRTSKKEGRKAYQENGNLTSFSQFRAGSDSLLEDTDETALIQVIRKLNPVIIVDESHHATSTLSKDMLKNFNPCFVLDLTATPKTGSNIISIVDAIKLKKEEMVKLPVIVYNRKQQDEVFISAISLRQKLESIAKKEQDNGGKYIRPIVLFQAQPRNSEDSTTYEKIKAQLVEMGIPDEQIAIKTGDKDEIKNVDLLSTDCPIRYIITVNALKEGWDCPFAYILATIANRSSVVDVEQILGRVLRMPGAKANKESVLNLSYVITSSNEFNATLDKVVAGLNAAGFSKKDYRVAEEEEPEVQIENPEPQQLTLGEGNQEPSTQVIVGEEEEDISVDTNHIREQLENVFSDNSENEQETTDEVTDMLTQAETQNNQYWEAAEEGAEANNSFDVPTEVRARMNRYKMDQRFANSAKKIRLPQFKIEMPPTIFSDNEMGVLTKENLYEGFTLNNKDTVIDFNNIEAQIAKVDIDENSEDSTPKTWKLQGFDNPYLKEWYDNFSTEGKLRQCKDMITKKIGRNNAVNQRELDAYVDRVIEGLSSEQLDDLQQNPYFYVKKIDEKINSLLAEHASLRFKTLVDQDKIICDDSYTFDEEISPVRTISSIPNSLYTEEEQFDTEYERDFVMRIASENNIEWWHRNIARHGFAINGAVNAYPDLIVRTKSGKILVIETKGDHLDNMDSRIKAETGDKWASMAGRLYKYFMVFQSKETGNTGQYSFDKFMEIFKEL